MTTLHRVAEASKKILIGFSIGIGSIIFFILLFRLFTNIKESLFPTPPPPPTVRFGKLPDIPFPTNTIGNSLIYSLNTVTGSLPILPIQMPVYRISQSSPSLLNFDNANTLAEKNGFNNTATQLSDTLYQWKNSDAIATTLTYNTLTGDFKVTSNYLYDPAVLAGANLPDEIGAQETAKTFLTGFNAFPSDIDESKTTTSLFTIQDGKVIPATSLSDAKLIAVDYYQKDIDTFSMFYPNYPTSTIHVVVASGDNDAQIVEATYTHKSVVTEDSSTYPIKTAKEAFDELNAKQGYVANFDGPGENVTIRNISLGYYVGETDQSYVYPIIIFQGDNNFYGYVNALTNEWIQK